MEGPLGIELLWPLWHNFILIYFRVFRDRSFIRLGEPIIDFNLISLMDMLSASFNMHNCDTNIQLLLAKPCRSKWEGRTLTPPIFLTLKWEDRAVQRGGSNPPNPPGKSHPGLHSKAIAKERPSGEAHRPRLIRIDDRQDSHTDRERERHTDRRRPDADKLSGKILI